MTKAFAFWLALGLAAVAEDPAVPLTARQAGQMALATHPRLKASLAQVVQAQEQIAIASSAGLPQINLTANRTAQQTTQGVPVQTTLFGIPQTFQSDSINYRYSHVGLEVRQLLFDGGGIAAQVHQLQASREAAYQDLVANAYQIYLDTELAYLELSEARQRLAASTAALAVAQKALTLTRGRYREGSSAEADIVYSQVDEARAALSVQETQHRSTVAEASLDRLIGLPQTTHLQLVEAPESALPVPNLQTSVAAARVNRPELKALEQQKSAAQFAMESLERSQAPKTYVVGGAEAVGYNTDLLPTSPGWRLGLELNWPIYQGGLQQHQVAQARARVQELEARLQENRQDVELQVRRAYADLETARDALRLSRTQREQTQKALDMALGQYQVGYATILQTSQAQVNHLQAETQLAVALQDVRRAQLRLEHATGQEPPGWGDYNQFK